MTDKLSGIAQLSVAGWAEGPVYLVVKSNKDQQSTLNGLDGTTNTMLQCVSKPEQNPSYNMWGF